MSQADYIQAKLESAGRTLMMLPAIGTKPRGHVSSWVEYAPDAMDYVDNAPTRMRATMQQMDELEEVEEWMVMLANYCREKRILWIAKTVAIGCLHNPVSEKRLYSWSKLARKMHKSPPTVKKWYFDGIDIIATLLAKEANPELYAQNVIKIDPRDKKG